MLNFSFESFVDGSFDYNPATKTHNFLWLCEENADIGGGKITGADKYQPSEEEIAEQDKVRERLRQEQEAFHDLVGYSADVAYGITKMPGKE